MFDNELLFMKKHKINANQFLYLKLIYSNKFSELFDLWEIHRQKLWCMKSINELFDKQMVTKPWLIENELLDIVDITPIFRFALDELYKDSPELVETVDGFDEFWNAYPNSMVINGVNMPLKVIKVKDRELFLTLYKTHSKLFPSNIIELLIAAKNNNRAEVNMRIDNFLINKQYESLAKWNPTEQDTKDMV